MEVAPMTRQVAKAEFEAWLIDGVFLKEGRDVRVLSRKQAEEHMKALAEEGNYQAIAELSDQLNSPVSLHSTKRRTSIRVSFPIYVKLFELALRRDEPLEKTVSDFVIKDLRSTLSILSSRGDVNRDKVRYLQDTLTNWLVERENEKGERENEDDVIRILSEPYRLTIRKLPSDWQELAEKIRDLSLDRFYRTYQGKTDISKELLERYVELAYDDDHFHWYVDEESVPMIDLGEIGELRIVSKLPGSCLIQIEDKDIKHVLEKEFGKEVSRFEEACPEAFQEGIEVGPAVDVDFSMPVEVNSEGIAVLDGIPVYKPDDNEDIKTQLLVLLDIGIAQRKSSLQEAIDRKDYAEVSLLSRELEELSLKRRIHETILDLILGLLRGKTQVISFSAPDCVIRAWKAFGDVEFAGLLGNKGAQGV